MANYLDQYKEYLSQSYKLISDIGLELALSIDNGELNNSAVNELLGYVFFGRNVRDLQATEDQRLDPLTAMVNQAPLLPIPIPLGFFGSVNIFPPSIPPLLSHSQLLNVLGPGELHLDDTLLNKLVSLPFNYGWDDIVGNNPLINAPLAAIISGLEPAFPASGNPARYLNGTKAFSQVQFSHLGGVPTTLAGYGISSSDTLFDGRYLRTNTVLSTYSLGSNTPLNNTQSIVQMFGNVQGQINAREAALGNPSTNGYILSSTTAGVRSWVPFAGGGTLNSVSINGLNGFAGTAVVTAGNAAITLRTSISGLLIGNGTAISAATEMTDYIGITGATNGDTILFTGGVATWAPGLSNPMTLLGDLIIGGASGATTRLAGNTTTTRKFLMSVGASGAALAQTYETLLAGDIPNIAISQVTNLQTNLDQKLSDNLLSGQIFIGNLSDLATGVVPSGDWTIDTTGVATIEPNAVTFDKFIQATGPQILVGTPDILGVQDFRQITLDPATLQIDAFGVMSSIATGTGTVTNTNTLTLNSLVLGDGGTAVKVGGGFTTDGVSQLTLGVSGASVGGLLLTNVTSGTIELRPVTGALGTTVLTLFAGSDTLVGLAATQTLTNKTLTNPQINGALLQTSSTVGYVWTATNTTGAGSWQAPTGGGGSGTVTSIATAGLISGGTITTTGTITTSMATNKLVGRGTAGTGIMEEITLGTGLSLTGTTLNATGGGSGTVTSVDLTMPTAFSVTGNPITTSGTLVVTGAGTVSQYIRGDGTLGIFPSAGGGGGGTVYYLNGNTVASPNPISGTTMYQLSPAAGTGAAANFTRSTTGAIASFITDVSSPNQTSIPAGIWIFECYLSETGSGANHAEVNAVVEKWDGTSITVIGTGPIEEITNGTTKDLYQFAVTIPSGTTILATDRIVIQINISNAHGKTVTLYTENGNVSSVITTFATGISSLNGLTASTQFLGAVGTAGNAPAWTSTTATHTLDIPLASAASVTAGLISKTEYDTFNGKLANVLTTTGDIIYSSSGTTAARLGIGITNQVLAVSAGGIPEWKTIAAGGDVTGPVSSLDGNFAVFDSTTGKIIKESAGASLSAAGAAVFNTSVTVGVSGVAPTGQLIFRNATTSATTILLASTSQTANLIYTWPISAPTVGQILSSDASGNLSWTAAGAGNVIAGGTNTFTGTNTFNAGTIRINNAANNGYHILASLAGSGGTLTATFPAATGTVPLLSLAQTFTAAQTFQAQVNIGGGSYNATILDFTGSTSNRINFSATPATAPAGGLTPSLGTRLVIANATGGGGSANSIGFNTGEMWLNNDVSGAISFYNNTARVARFTLNYLELLSTVGQIRMAGSSSNIISFNANGSAAPAYSSGGESAGTKIVFYPNVGTGTNSYAIGVNSTQLWTAGATSYAWFGINGANIMTIDGSSLSTALTSFSLINTNATTVNFAGAATTLNIGTTTSAITALNIGTGAGIANKTINIGTAATAGTTTINIGSAGGATNTIAIRGNLTLGTSGGNMGFWGTAAVARQTITSDTLANLYTALRAYGLIL